MTRFRLALAAFIASLVLPVLGAYAPLVINGKPLIVGGASLQTARPATLAPIITPTTTRFVASGAALSYTPSLSQGDSPVTWTASGLPGWASINSSTGAITGTASTGASTVKITATNSAGADDHWVRIHAYSSTANISNTGAVQYLTTSGRKYTLTENITAPGCVLAATATNIGVDLAGYTINSNGATPISVTDGGFESVAGWSFASAANASQFTGTYLNNTLFSGTKSLRFDCPTATSQYVESSATYTLATSTVYSISYFCYVGDTSAGANPGVTFYVSLVGTGGESTITSSYSGNFYRGMQLVTYTFTSPSSGTPTYKIRCGITGGGSSSNDAYFDLIELARSHAVAVTVSPRNYAPTQTPELDQYGDASGFTLANGTITQGSDAAPDSNGVFVYATDNVHLADLTITTTGKNSQSVQGLDQGSSFPVHMTCCTLTNNCPASGNRDGFAGSAVLDCAGAFDRCSVTNTVHGGYAIYGNGVNTFIWRSSFVQNARYTNAFAIQPQISSSGANVVAYNTITNDGGTESGRGIYLRGTVDCHHNTVTVRQEDNVQEYNGAPLAGAHAIQLETHQGGNIYNNTVIVTGSGGGQCVRTTYDGEEGPVPTADLYWHDNTFIVDADASPTSATGERHPSVFKPVATDLSLEHYDDNTITTNCSLVFFQEANTNTLTIEGGTIRYIDDAIDNDYPFVSGYANTGTNRCPGNVLIQDVALHDAGTATWLDQPVKDYYGWSNLSSSTATSIIVRNTATLTLTSSGTPIPNAAVTVVDNQGNTVYNSTTNSSGVITFQAKDWDRINATRHDFNPHTITVSGHSGTTSHIDAINGITKSVAIP